MTIDAVLTRLRETASVEVRLQIRCKRCGFVNKVTLGDTPPDDAEIRRWANCPSCFQAVQRERAHRPHRRR